MNATHRDLEMQHVSGSFPHRSNEERGGRDVDNQGCFNVFFVLSFATFIACILPWGIVSGDFDDCKHACNHSVDAIVIDQNRSSVYGKCDLTLSWKDARRNPMVSVVRWDCDPNYSKGDRNITFPQPTCYKDGDIDLRVMGVERYDVYDSVTNEFIHHRYGSNYVCSSSEHRHLKRTSTALFIAWIIAISPIAFTLVAVCCMRIFETISNMTSVALSKSMPNLSDDENEPMITST